MARYIKRHEEEVANSNSVQIQLTLDLVGLFFTLSLIKVLTLLQFFSVCVHICEAPQCPCVVNDGNCVCDLPVAALGWTLLYKERRICLINCLFYDAKHK